MRLLAAAKINLHLRVGAVQPSGFHPLMSWFVTIGLFDTLFCTPQANGLVSIACDSAQVPTDQRNLILKAALLLQRESARPAAVPMAARGAKFELQKQIPIGGGLGGGSSDAARTITALNHLWNLGMSDVRMREIAETLGSDVPFFLQGQSCICTGRGEIIRPIAAPKPRWALLILPELSISTAEVYKTFDRLNLGKDLSVDKEPDWREWSQQKTEALLPLLVNDLETPAFETNPELRRLRSDTEQALGRVVRMSGSGSTLFTLFDEESEAQAARRGISEQCKVVPLVPMILDDLMTV